MLKVKAVILSKVFSFSFQTSPFDLMLFFGVMNWERWFKCCYKHRLCWLFHFVLFCIALITFFLFILLLESMVSTFPEYDKNNCQPFMFDHWAYIQCATTDKDFKKRHHLTVMWFCLWEAANLKSTEACFTKTYS